MSRPSSVRKPRRDTVRHLERSLANHDLPPLQQRRAETILLHDAGMSAVDIARVLGVHVNTVYGDLHAFAQHGLPAVITVKRRGARANIRQSQLALIARLADRAPYELGLPYGRWSLGKLQQFLIQRRIIKSISREHLRRLLKKRDSAFVASRGSSPVRTHVGRRS